MNKSIIYAFYYGAMSVIITVALCSYFLDGYLMVLTELGLTARHSHVPQLYAAAGLHILFPLLYIGTCWSVSVLVTQWLGGMVKQIKRSYLVGE